MNKQSSHLLRWLAPAGLGAFLLAGATAVSAQDSETLVLTFEDAMDVAIKSSPTMIQQEMSLEQGRLSYRRSEMALRSQLTLRIDPYQYSRTEKYDDFNSQWFTTENQSSQMSFNVEQPIVMTDGTLSFNNYLNYSSNTNTNTDKTITKYQSGLSVTYEQPLFRYNQQKMELEDLKMQLRETEISYINSRLSIERQVTQWISSFYQAKNDLDTATKEFDDSKKNLQMTQNKVDAGMLAQNELNQQMITYAKSEMSYEDAVQAFEDQKDQFRRNLGLPLDQDVDVDLEIEFIPVEIDEEFAVAQMLANSFELEQDQMRIVRADNSLIETKAQDRINGDFSFTYGIKSTEDEIGDLYKDSEQQQEFGFGINLPVFDWGVRDLRIRQQELSHESTMISIENSRTDYILSIRQQVRDLNKMIRTYELNVQSAELSQITYDIAVVQFGNGEISAMELQQKQEQLTSAQRSLVQDRITYKLALLDLKNDTHYDFEKGQPVDVEALLEEGN